CWNFSASPMDNFPLDEKTFYEVSKLSGKQNFSASRKRAALTTMVATEDCILALEQIHSHARTKESPGTPLNTYYLQVFDKFNFVGIAYALLKIPVLGSTQKEMAVKEIFLHFKDGQQIPMFKFNGDNAKKTGAKVTKKIQFFPKVAFLHHHCTLMGA
ncbi:Cytochrome c oxidase assembly factor 1, partial [Galemys pyrenaicus]